MAVNDPTVVPSLTQPRAIVKLNGTRAPGLISFTVDSNNYYRANTFEALFSLRHNDSGSPINWAWWSDQDAIEVEIRAGFPADPNKFSDEELEVIFIGIVDEFNSDPIENTIRCTGRDLSSKLIEVKTTEKYPNLTSSEIVEKLGKDAGIEVKAVATKQKAGEFYNEEHVRLQNERTVWDLMCFLAQQEEYVVFLKGKVLHFEPAPKEDSDPYIVRYVPPDDNRPYPTGNFLTIDTRRSLTIARDVIVIVKSWNSKKKRNFTATAKSSKSQKRQNSGGEAQTYSYTIPGLTQEQVIKKAESILADISKHERILAWTAPADTLLDESSVIQLEGTGTSFDQKYFADHVARRYSKGGGFIMEVRAKNHSPVSTVTA